VNKYKAAAGKINYPVFANRAKKPLVVVKPVLKLVEVKPVEVKPVEVKPIEVKPIVKVIKAPEEAVQVVNVCPEPIEQINSSAINICADLGNLNCSRKLKEVNSNDEIESNCPLCYNLMVQPRKLKCGHRFCAQCMIPHY
jgi:hypothetical protein